MNCPAIQGRNMRLLFWTTLFLVLAGVYGSQPFSAEDHLDDTKKYEISSDDSSPAIISRRADYDDLDLELDLTAEESVVEPHTDDQPEARYRNPFPFAFNGGKPFSLEKDPITGQIDFEKAPPLKAVNFTDQYDQDVDDSTVEETTSKEALAYLNKKSSKGKNDIAVGPNEINPYSPSFHDFLNLPVQYSSDKYAKDKYPLISSSYANTKVQSGSNLYNIYNHRLHHETATRSSSNNVVTRRAYTTQPTTTEPQTTTTTTTTITTTEAPRPATSDPVPPITFSSSSEPPITTWKPPKITSRYEVYDDILPIEKLQNTKYDNDRPRPNHVVSHSTKAPVVKEYAYDDYEEESEEDHRYSNIASTSKVKTNLATSTTRMTTTISESDHYPTSSTTSSTILHSSVAPTITSETTRTPKVPPVTSMPLDNENHLKDSSYENIVEGHRQDFINTVISGPGHVHFPNAAGRPTGMLPESTSNIVIPPDQDTVSFVLGNRQNVEGSYYTHGSVGDNTYSGFIGEGSFRPIISSGQQSPGGSPVDRRVTIALPSVAVVDHGVSNQQQWYKPRPLPPNSNSPNSHPSISKSPITNEVDPLRPRPLAVSSEEIYQQQIETDDNKKGYVVFPGRTKSQEPQRPVEEHVVVINEAEGTIKEYTTSSTTSVPIDPVLNNNNDNNNNNNNNSNDNNKLPEPSENLTPPTERPRPPGPAQRPPYYFHYQHLPTSRPEFSRPSRLPLQPRPKPGTSMEPVIFKRRPVSPDMKLPNILPQFRPNAKASHGHRGSETIGTIPAQAYHSRPRPPPSSFSRRPSPPSSFLQRLSPPPLPPPSHVHHTLRNTIAPPKEDSMVQNSDSVVKRIRLPQSVNPLGNGPVRENERVQSSHFPVAMGQKASNQHPEEDRGERFSAEPPQVPPRPVLFPRHRTDDNAPRVSTLQMIQQRGGGLDESVVRSNLPPPLRGNLRDNNQTDADRRKDVNQDSGEVPVETPVYVVYPVNTAVNIGQDDSREKDESVVVGTHGPHRPLPPDTLLQDDNNDDDEIKENPEIAPIISLPAKHYPDAGTVVASEFPYPLEKPDPALLSEPVHETPLLVPNDQKQKQKQQQQEQDEEGDGNLNVDNDDKDSSVNIIPYLQDFVPFPAKKNDAISATLHRFPPNSNLPLSSQPSTPIAYVFTPTAQPIIHRSDLGFDDDSLKFDRGDEKPVLLPSQQPSSSSSSAPSPQNFMAPFIASANAEAPVKNGWNVVPVEANDRSRETETVENVRDALTAEDTQTERSEFDPDNFKPQLFGGFKPIYEFPTEDEEHQVSREKEVKDMPRSLS